MSKKVIENLLHTTYAIEKLSSIKKKCPATAIQTEQLENKS